MANTKSAMKNHRKTLVRTLHNRSQKSRLKTLAKKVSSLAESGDKEALRQAAISYISAMDKAAKTNLIHANKANHAKSSMSKYLAV